jgi:hypothetical protein
MGETHGNYGNDDPKLMTLKGSNFAKPPIDYLKKIIKPRSRFQKIG